MVMSMTFSLFMVWYNKISKSHMILGNFSKTPKTSVFHTSLKCHTADCPRQVEV